ncbi:MAG TPA: hypothetical protein VGJ86_06520 [Acidimicrobiales bacterium]
MFPSTLSKVFFFFHILSIVVAFAPASVHSVLANEFAQDSDSTLVRKFSGLCAKNGQRIYAPALVLAGLFGMLLVARDDTIADWDQGWVGMALVTWIAMNGVVHGLIIRSEKRVAQGDDSAKKTIELGGMIVTLLFLFMLYLMIWKPGL